MAIATTTSPSSNDTMLDLFNERADYMRLAAEARDARAAASWRLLAAHVDLEIAERELRRRDLPRE